MVFELFSSLRLVYDSMICGAQQWVRGDGCLLPCVLHCITSYRTILKKARSVPEGIPLYL